MTTRKRGCEHDPKRQCPDCRRASRQDYDRRRYAANPEKKKKAQAQRYLNNPEVRARMILTACKWQKENPGKLRKNSILRKYGITAEQYQELLAFQGSGCGSCAAPFEADSFKYPIDHVHEGEHKGRIRGILCQGCNHGGGLTDSIPLIEAKIRYLQDPPAFRLWPDGP